MDVEDKLLNKKLNFFYNNATLVMALIIIEGNNVCQYLLMKESKSSAD